MVESKRIATAELHDLLRQVDRSGRRHKLAVDNLKLLAVPGELAHQFHEIQSALGATMMFSIKRGGPKNEVSWRRAAYKVLARQLRVAVYIEWLGQISFAVWHPFGTIKNVICAEMDKESAQVRHSHGDIAGSARIYRKGLRGIQFALLNLVE